MKTQRFLYNRSDFSPLPLKLEHMDIYLNFRDDTVEGVNILRLTAREHLHSVALDARNLDILAVEWASERPFRPLNYDYQHQQHRLVIRLPHEVEAGHTFHIRTVTSCRPSDRLLEGIYKDTTPPGAPQQYMSQCQQWGFQRILPVLDDCTAKCTMVTTIEADARYTHMISNGDVSRSRHPDGRPVPKPGDPSRRIITYENNIPMAPYLFLVCVGTWDVLEDKISYPSGRSVRLEYLVPPGRQRGAVLPMDILKKAVLWQGRTQDYEYLGEVYRTICMERSNFGGMENLGNTTIITAAALIDEWTHDRHLQYAYGVIVHEFEHNQCGSEVTMETPFDMWLNEAFTVDVERQFVRSQFDPACVRLDQMDAMREPLAGPLAVEDAGHMGNIVREGFNDPDELVDGVTYVKAAEVINMLKLIIGDKAFRQGAGRYFAKFKGGNANTDDFFACFEEASGRDLAQFKREWLYTIGYPCIEATTRYDAARRSLHIKLRQTRTGKGGLFHVPIRLAAVDRDGRDLVGTSCVAELTNDAREFVFADVDRPAFLSLNRDMSFYGTFKDCSATAEQLAAQVKLDPDPVNRVEAMRRLTDVERHRLVADPSAHVGEAWTETFGDVLLDEHLAPGLKAYLLRIDEQSLNRKLLPLYRERYQARARLMETAARRFWQPLNTAFEAVDTYTRFDDPTQGIENRKLKSVLLRILVQRDTPEAQHLAEDHFHKARHITDKTAALLCVNLTSHPKRRQLVDEGYELWKDHLNAYLGYLQIIGAGVHDDVFDMLADEEQRPTFILEHPGHQRALFLGFATNNKKLWTGQGITWVTEAVARLAPLNENTANRLLACFKQVHNLGEDLRPRVIEALNLLQKRLDPEAAPSVFGRVQTYLDEKEPSQTP